jgi:smad nuclear-interacting protein 1
MTTATSTAGTATSTLFELRKVWGREEQDDPADPPPMPDEQKVKADFGLSGALAKDAATGNMYNGVVLKWSEPQDSARPTKQWRLYVMKNGTIAETLHLHRQSAYLFGRDTRVADVILQHESCSKQHAVLQYRLVEDKSAPGASSSASSSSGARRVVKPYLMDLGSTHKTFLNGAALEDARYYELREKDCVKFAGSTREYILLHAESDDG